MCSKTKDMVMAPYGDMEGAEEKKYVPRGKAASSWHVSSHAEIREKVLGQSSPVPCEKIGQPIVVCA